MGYKSAKVAKRDDKSVPRKLIILFSLLLLFAPENVSADNHSSDVILDISQFFEVGNELRPRKGQLIAPSEIGVSGHNFRFCDGSTGIVERSSLVLAFPCKAGKREGFYVTKATYPDDLVGAKVFSSNNQPAGTVETANFIEGKNKIEIKLDDGSIHTFGSWESVSPISQGILAINRKNQIEIIIGMMNE